MSLGSADFFVSFSLMSEFILFHVLIAFGRQATGLVYHLCGLGVRPCESRPIVDERNNYTHLLFVSPNLLWDIAYKDLYNIFIFDLLTIIGY